MKKKLLSLILALAMLLSLAACGGNNDTPSTPDQTPTDTPDTTDTTPPADTTEPDTVEPLGYDEDELFELNFAEFADAYELGRTEVSNMSKRWALMAIAEAKLLESGLLIPFTTQGGNYGMNRIANHTITSILYGNDSDRFHQMVVTEELIKATDRPVMNEKWSELRGTGEYEAWLKGYLTEQGYHIKDTLNYPYSDTLETWDILSTSQAPEAETLVHTFDGLLEYNIEDVLSPALAESYEISEDGLTYTFHLRNNAVWVDSQGREVAKVVADDFVAGMQHLMDAEGGLETLLSGVIKGAKEYIDKEDMDFSKVGVSAPDDYTVVYTLEQPTPYLMTMLGYSIFAPMSRSYYESQGGKFGTDYDSTAADYNYGKSPDTIAYCGPYLVTSDTPQNSRIFKANPTYWNADNINIKTMNWVFEDGSDATKTYVDLKAGVIDSAGINSSTLEIAKTETDEAGNNMFDTYARVGSTNASSYYNSFNVARRQFANYNDDTKLVTTQTEEDQARTHEAVNNVHFRLAVGFAMDRGTSNAQAVGEDLKYVALRNTFTPGNFVSLEEETTVDINGTATTFPVGTYYAEIIQAQLTADGFPAQVWDADNDADDKSTNFDGWYNEAAAKEEWAVAKEELAARGIEISAENPIYLDVPTPNHYEPYLNRNNVLKQSIEKALGGEVIINLVAATSWQEVNDAAFYPKTGAESNFDVTFNNFGWNPDWGDPNNYLDQLIPGGYMVKGFGLYS